MSHKWLVIRVNRHTSLASLCCVRLCGQESLGGSAHIQHMESEGESINKGRNHGAAFKQLIQAREQQVRGNNGAGALVAVRDDLKKSAWTHICLRSCS